ncbi:formimidoylglutamate deiminase [Aurantimonas sp. Leaf443]|uniref:formimidoylglutamate deiminase n=1 Tax=Aurantimonas sp. Leaf443 TaxID=1736378 RepID=UPI0006F89B76|nr:formimidoylglutamate deiminase [Aurantimonas sp. Leaf443]KQT84059.1 N-formimino-L-glutamate deiminase [Aurantimonas sp. Leaf443]
MSAVSTRLFCPQALLPGGWERDVAIGIDAQGRIADLATGASKSGCEILAGPVVPGLANCHSHAFQRAMAGLAECAGAGEDSFWTWRAEMYRTVGLMGPDDVEAIAAKLYVELLKGGFTRVAEFHYLHHGPDGTPYADPARTSLSILAAAGEAGIGLTHLPVFYAHANFGGAAPGEGQRPFLHDVDGFLRLLERLQAPCEAAGATLGLALHSLRAATPGEIAAILAAEATGGPIHIHVAEQEREVEDCLAWSGRRPVDWLVDEAPVDARWCAIHATHMTQGETARLAASGAVAGLCPATEANLGDGIFPATAFLKAGGRLAIGTDSHVATSVGEELRLLEYGQRLRDRRRARLASGPGASVGRTLFDAALAGGAQACGAGLAGLQPGAAADLLVLDGADPYLATAQGDALLDRWLFALGPSAVRDVLVGGRFVVREGRHARDEAIDAAFLKTLRRLQ